MAIKILEEPDVSVTADELNRFRQDYEAMCRYMVNPPSFESYVRSGKGRKAKAAGYGG